MGGQVSFDYTWCIGRHSRPIQGALWIVALSHRAQGGLTPFESDPVYAGVGRFQHNVYIPVKFLEHDDRRCDSLLGPLCACQLAPQIPVYHRRCDPYAIHGHCNGPVDLLAGIYSIFGSLTGDPGFFVQNEIGSYFENEHDTETNQRIGTLPAMSLQIGFDNFPPWFADLPEVFNVTTTFSVITQGRFALVSPIRVGTDTGSRTKKSTVHAEVHDAVVRLTFSEPVIVEEVWLARGNAELRKVRTNSSDTYPVVLRARHLTDEHWSAYLHDHELGPDWMSPSTIAPALVSEIVILGGQGLAIASIVVSRVTKHVDVLQDNADFAKYGWLLTPKERMFSLHDLTVSRLVVPSAAAIVSIAELHKFGCMRLRTSLFGGDNDEPGVEMFPSTVSNGRTVASMQTMIVALRNGSFEFPPDIPMEWLESDLGVYAETLETVTIEEAVNAHSLDDLFERLFLSAAVDHLDLLLLRFLRSSQSESSILRGRSSSRGVFTIPEADSGASVTHMRDTYENASEQTQLTNIQNAFLSDLKSSTSRYARWQQPIETKLNILNISSAIDLVFMLTDNTSLLDFDYYNAASGLGRRDRLEVPDAEFFLAELLGLESQLLVDRRGFPLPEVLARRMKRNKTYLIPFKNILEELQINTSGSQDVGELLNSSQNLSTITPVLMDVNFSAMSLPPFLLVFLVSCIVCGTVLAIMFAPPIPIQRWLAPLRSFNERMRRQVNVQ